VQNFVQPGDMITVTAPTGGLASGAPVLVGKLFGVAAFTAAAGAPVEIATIGVFDLPKTSGQTFNVGDQAYWDATGNLVTSTATSNSWIGVVTKGALGGDATVRVRLNQHPI
jgi:predicted RecA/RadA family phage recombinase